MPKVNSSLVTSPRIMEIRRKRKKRIIFAVIFYLLSIIIIFIGLIFLSRLQKMRIVNIEIKGTHIVDNTQIIENINNHINGKYLYLFNRNNAFIYPQNKIKNDLLIKFPRINNIDISLKGLNTMIVNIDERTGAYLWCGANIPEVVIESGDNCYFINSNGEVFDKAPYFSGNVYFKFYVPIDGMEDPLNKIILNKDTFQKIIAFVDGLNALGLNSTSVVMNDPEAYVFHLERKGNIFEPIIYFNKENDLNKIFENLSSAMSKKEFKDNIISKYNNLHYIDLRFNNKVLYKFRNE